MDENIINKNYLILGKTKRRDLKKKSEFNEGVQRENNLLPESHALDNKWGQFGYKGCNVVPSGQSLKKSEGVSVKNDLSVVTKTVGEIRRTSEGDVSKTLSGINIRQPEPNGVRKDLINQEKRRRLSLVDEKDLQLSGNFSIIFIIFHVYTSRSPRLRLHFLNTSFFLVKVAFG